jgi:3D (Asp-Asp-Asp) domain-containing protein
MRISSHSWTQSIKRGFALSLGYGAAAILVAASAVIAKEIGSAPLIQLQRVPEPVALLARPTAAAQSPKTSIISALPTADGSPADAYFDYRPMRKARTITMRVTAYSPDAQSCGEFADGKTATLHSVTTNGGHLVAADIAQLPYGTVLHIPGYAGDTLVPVLDCGGAIKGNRLDVLFPTHEEAMQWGVRELEVTVYEYADGMPVVSPRRLR